MAINSIIVILLFPVNLTFTKLDSRHPDLFGLEFEGPRIVHDTLRRLYDRPYMQQNHHHHQQQLDNDGNAADTVKPSLL